MSKENNSGNLRGKSAKQLSEIRRNERRKGAPSFSAVRLDTTEQSAFISNVVTKNRASIKQSLLDAFQALDEKLDNEC